jgi:hypothetical protein
MPLQRPGWAPEFLTTAWDVPPWMRKRANGPGCGYTNVQPLMGVARGDQAWIATHLFPLFFRWIVKMAASWRAKWGTT